MSQSKRIVHVNRSFGVHLAGRNEAVELTVGRNEVDAEVAEHPFVKAHMTDPDDIHHPAAAAELESAKLRIADLEAQLAGNGQDAKVAELEAEVERLNAEVVKRDESGIALADMLEAANAKVAELEDINKALSMTAEKTAKK